MLQKETTFMHNSLPIVSMRKWDENAVVYKSVEIRNICKETQK